MIFIVFLLFAIMGVFTIQSMEKGKFESYKYGKRLEKQLIGSDAMLEEIDYLIQSNAPFKEIINTLTPYVSVTFERWYTYELLYRALERYRLYCQSKCNSLKGYEYNNWAPSKDNILNMIKPGPEPESYDMYEEFSFLIESNATFQEIMGRLIKGTVDLKKYVKMLIYEALHMRETDAGIELSTGEVFEKSYLVLQQNNHWWHCIAENIRLCNWIIKKKRFHSKLKFDRLKPRSYHQQKLSEHQKQKLLKQPRVFCLIKTGASLEEIEKELIANLGDMHCEYKYSTALIEAAKVGREDLVKLFISRGAKIDQSAGGDRNTALKGAIGRGNCTMVALLIKLGANCNKPSNSSYWGPLSEALDVYLHSCKYENSESVNNRRNILNLLIQNNATIRWPTRSLPSEIESNSVIKEILIELGREGDFSKISIR